IHLFDTSKPRSRPVRVTAPGFDDRWPSFDPAGRYLYFTSARVLDPVYDPHFHDYEFPTGTRPPLITLRADVPSPFDPAQRPVRAPGAPPPSQPKDNGQRPESEGGDAPEQEPTENDEEGMEDQVVAFPMPPWRYGPAFGANHRPFVRAVTVRAALAVHDDPTWRLA